MKIGSCGIGNTCARKSRPDLCTGHIREMRNMMKVGFLPDARNLRSCRGNIRFLHILSGARRREFANGNLDAVHQIDHFSTTFPFSGCKIHINIAAHHDMPTTGLLLVMLTHMLQERHCAAIARAEGLLLLVHFLLQLAHPHCTRRCGFSRER